MNLECFNPEIVKRLKPFPYGATVFGGHFGDEGKGKIIDILAEKYHRIGCKILSIRGNGGGNAGHTVEVDGNVYHFHYLTSAVLSADKSILGAGMNINPIKVLEESEVLPEELRKKIFIDERATLCSDFDGCWDVHLENVRSNSGKPIIGTTGSGNGTSNALRCNRDHITFADVKKKVKCAEDLKKLYLNIPDAPEEAKAAITDEYVNKLFEAINKLNIVDAGKVIYECRMDRKNEWAVILEVSQGMALDPLQGNGGHFTTSTPCSDIGAAAYAGLTMYDFPNGSTMVLKAYSSKVGAGPFIVKFTKEEEAIDDYIHDVVGEYGVTTHRKRMLGWFDGPAVRMALEKTLAKNICINCLDVIGQIPVENAKICYAYKNIYTGEITYRWPYFLDEYEPLYIEVPVGWDCYQAKNIGDLDSKAINYIRAIEEVIGAKVTYVGTGGSREDIIKLY